VIAGHRVERVMARPPRLHVPGGFYHVTLRGNHRQPIFFRDSDRPLLDEIVADTLARLEARLHAYCWMTNHIHILIQVSAAPLGQVVMRIESRYARTVQAGIQTTGHLFERRYHAALVDEDRYLLALIRYIHLNPVRGALVNRPGDYPWSSHHEYVGTREQPWVTTSFALQMLGTQTDSARAAYRELIDEPGGCIGERDSWHCDATTARYSAMMRSLPALPLPWPARPNAGHSKTSSVKPAVDSICGPR
jgi:putative transposase